MTNIPSLFRVEIAAIDELGRDRIVQEYVEALNEEEAGELGMTRATTRKLSIKRLRAVTPGYFVGSTLPPARPAKHWEEVKDMPDTWRFEFYPHCYLMLHAREKAKGEGYLVWLELNGQPSLEDVEMHSAEQDILSLQKGAAAIGADLCLEMMQVFTAAVTGPAH